MFMYGMGIIQYCEVVCVIYMLINLLFMCGNIGKLGVGICFICGYFNVQGQCIVGIIEKLEMVFNDKLCVFYYFELLMEKGFNMVEVCEKICDGELFVFFMLGGNFV